MGGLAGPPKPQIDLPGYALHHCVEWLRSCCHTAKIALFSTPSHSDRVALSENLVEGEDGPLGLPSGAVGCNAPRLSW